MTGPPHREERDTDVPVAVGARERASSPRSGRRVGVALVAVGALAVGLAGSVAPWQQALVHAAAAALAVYTASWSADRLIRAGVAARLAAIAAIGPALCVLSLAWAPRGLVAAVAPGIAVARPTSVWLPLSASPEATVGEIGRGMLVVTVVAVAATWAGARSHAARRLVIALAAGAFALAVFAALHAVTGAREVLGVLPVMTPRQPFFAPLVNANHLGALLALGLPATLGAARDGGRWAPLWWVGAALVAVVLLAIQSPGAWLAAAVAVGVWALRESGSAGRLAVGVAALAGAAVLAAGGAGWVESSVGRRIAIWRDLPAMAADHWLFGVGGGTFGEAFRPYRTAADWEHVVHAHSDVLEVLVEHGAVGVIAWVVALVVAVRWWRAARVGHPEASRLRWRVGAGLIGVGVQATWEFALQIPGVLVIASAVLASLVASTIEPRTIDAGRWRRVLWALAAAEVVAAGWSLREAIADRAAITLATAPAPDDDTDRAERVLAWTAPWRGERAVYAAWTALASRDASTARGRAIDAAARFPHDPDTLRRAGLVLARSGAPVEAEAALRRAIDRDPGDYRSWAALARLLGAQGRTMDALEAWRQAIARWPWQYADRGDPIAEAWPLLPLGLWWIQALEDAPGFWSLELAKHLEREGQDDEAFIALEQAVRLRPAYVDSIARGVLLHRTGHLDEAEEALTRMLVTRPEAPGVGLELGYVLLAQGRPDEALATWRDTARWHPSYEPVRVVHVRAVADHDGAEAAVVAARAHLLDGQARPHVALEMARQEMAAGRPGDCLRTLASRVPTTDPALATERETVRAACRAACPKCEDPE